MKSKLSTLNSQLSTFRGFTLIELLIVIAVLGVLAAGVVVAIDPVDRINSANDSRAINDVGVIGRASEAYATTKSGFYPATITNLTANGDLKVDPQTASPTGYTYTFTPAPSACTAGTTCTSVVVTTGIKSKKYTSTPFWRYESSTGKSCAVALATTACP